MNVSDGMIKFNDDSGGSVPKMVRTGGALFGAFSLPDYPKWITGANGKPYLAQSAEDEQSVITAIEKALAKGAAAK